MTEAGDPLEASLDEIAHRFSSLSTPASIDLLRRFVGEILRWNGELGLVSKKDPLTACRRLIIESAEFGDVVGRALGGVAEARIADVGSGAGFPGVVWRLQRDDFELVLIERREKRAVFLEKVVRSLRLDRVDVRAADARDVSRLQQYRGSFDVVSAMAVGDPVRTVPQVQDLLVAGGLFATTLPEEAVAPGRCGRLALEDDVRGEFGRYGLYRNRV